MIMGAIMLPPVQHTDVATEELGVPYNYKSVMHYKYKDFSVNGKPTIEAIHPRPEEITFGNNYGFTQV